MNLSKMSSKPKCDQCGCPTAKPKKGKKLDTQMFPKCKGTKYDRDIVKKTREKNKKSSSEDQMTKKARFGEDMKGTDGMFWENWKSKNYFSNDTQPPSYEEAETFIVYCDDLFNRPQDSFISSEGRYGGESYARLKKKIEIVRVLPEYDYTSILAKARQYQSLMHDIERDGVLSDQEYLNDVDFTPTLSFNLKQYRESQRKG